MPERGALSSLPALSSKTSLAYTYGPAGFWKEQRDTEVSFPLDTVLPAEDMTGSQWGRGGTGASQSREVDHQEDDPRLNAIYSVTA